MDEISDEESVHSEEMRQKIELEYLRRTRITRLMNEHPELQDITNLTNEQLLALKESKDKEKYESSMKIMRETVCKIIDASPKVSEIISSGQLDRLISLAFFGALYNETKESDRCTLM